MKTDHTQSYLDAIDENKEGIVVIHEKIERKLPLHSHQKGQLTYVQGGIAYIHAKNISYIIPARHYVWVPKALPHYLEVRHHGTVIRNIYYNAEGDENNPFFSELSIYPINNLLFEMIIFTERWNGLITAKDQGYQFLSTIKNLLPVLNTQAFPIALPTTKNERLKPIILYMNLNFAHALNLEDLSHLFGMSERTFSRLFQSAMSISFLQYLKLLRIVKAIEMILETEKSTSEIAFATGYNSLAAFSKAFYQQTGSRPSDFRKSSFIYK
ncbi:helix-turn-helix domain-containing protein [Pedobacter sp.]|uniref:helix-turn-helix domain-containing protein n=1 Tax=Pedobacter sp. TaxID=1411316 RepID=UPI003D7FBEFD